MFVAGLVNVVSI